ncbi:hypothetical protein [Pseudomonas xionganensis]|uniref:Uncharacterized protein n=1 Tax=Pseudomonas xionganensis TaxID=2654845 RepID=A0A6I4KUN0_9PSED|nr:hypothetical protein [Pseudomonas xionganensis]MVW75401.1 hypothetical protein [Pseudomonas xionganensis]
MMIPGILAQRRHGGGAPAAFPVIRNAQAVASTGADETLTLNYSASAGDLVIVVFGQRASASFPPSLDDTGWDLLIGNGNANAPSFVFTKVVAGGGTLTITPGLPPQYCAAVVIVIEAGTHQGAVENATSTGSGSPNPTPLTPSWGAAKTLWIATYIQAYGSTVSSYPLPNNQLHARSGTTSSNISTAMCADSQEVETLDPATFSVSNTAGYTGRTLAVRPAA